MVGLALSIAIGVAGVLWSIEPHFQPLFANLSSQDSGEVIEVLQKNGIQYKLDKQQGTILVAADDIHDARIKLSQQGLPNGEGNGFESLSNNSSFGVSQFMEDARYRHALEAELARTITSIHYVKSARVHLAMPKRTVFLRDEKQATASVFIDIYSGRSIGNDQVASIAHLVASSVPGLKSQDVTVVDNQGHLLTDGDEDGPVSTASKYLKYRQQLEMQYSSKIQDLLVPILGPNKVQTRVTADIDFTSETQTQELFNPQAVVKSEQLVQENKSSSSGSAGGVPGTLTNTPPESQVAVDEGIAGSEVKTSSGSGDTRKQEIKNYEVGKTISHTQKQPGHIKRLSVAVVLDDHVKIDPKTKKSTSVKITADELKEITALVKDAIGFNKERGDVVNVTNRSFAVPEEMEDLPAPKIWEEAWFWSLVKQTGGVLCILVLVLGVLRPILRTLVSKPVPTFNPMLERRDAGSVNLGIQGGGQMQFNEIPQSPADRLQMLQGMASNNPKRVAQVVKTWVDGN